MDIFTLLGSESTKIVITVISTAVGIILTITKINTILPRPRLYLKEDIEIMKSLSKGQEEYDIVSQYVKNRIHQVYLRREKDTTLFDPSKTFPKIVGMIMVFFGIYLTYAVHKSDEWSSWWYIGTIYLAIVGVAMSSILNIGKRRVSVPHDIVHEENTQT